MRATIFDIKEMALHDGPGIRTTVFFKGCPLRCKWCHNPEGLSMKPQLMYKEVRCVHCKQCEIKCEHKECKVFGKCILSCPENCLEITGREVNVKELSDELKKGAEILGSSFGGFTFSGGEPLYQWEYIKCLIKELKDYHLCIETSGYADENVFGEMLEKMDLVIMDIKIADDALHRKYTGVSNEKILRNFEALKNSSVPYIIRTPLIDGITDTKENLDTIKEIIGDSHWEKLPQNTIAAVKYKMLGMKYEL